MRVDLGSVNGEIAMISNGIWGLLLHNISHIAGAYADIYAGPSNNCDTFCHKSLIPRNVSVEYFEEDTKEDV